MPQSGVFAAVGEKFVVGTEFGNQSINDDGNTVSVVSGVQSVGNGDDRPSVQDGTQ